MYALPNSCFDRVRCINQCYGVPAVLWWRVQDRTEGGVLLWCPGFPLYGVTRRSYFICLERQIVVSSAARVLQFQEMTVKSFVEVNNRIRE